MAKRINSSEIVQPDLLGDLRESMVKTESKTIALSIQLNAVNDILVDIKNNASTIKEGVLNLGKTTTKDLDARAKAQKKANILAKDAIEAEKIKAKLIADYEKLESQREKRLQKLAIQEEKNHSKREKQYNKEIEKAREQDREYVKTSRLLNEMRNRYKDLAISMEKGIKLTRDERNEMRSLSNQIQSTDASLKKIDASVGQHQRNVGNYSSAIGGLRNGLSQLGLSFGVFQTLKVAKDALVDFEEGAADIAKTTGLTTDNAKKLSRELLNFDTKTSVSELQGLTAAAGSLNVEGNKNILDFVENADKAFVALGDDLGGTSQEIATNVGKIAGVFGDEKEFGIGEAINKVGSSINDLAGKSKAAAAPILDFTQRVAGLGNLIKSYDAAALGAFFDEGGQSVEVAASTLNTLLPKLATDYKKFAKVAGLSAEEFKKLAEDSPVEALKAVANGAKNSEKGLFNLSKTVESFGVDSARATSIVGYLANNTDRLTELQKISNEAYKEGTSLTDEFNKKNETLGANIDKVTKEFLKYAIGLDESGNISGKFSSGLKFLATNMKTILVVVTQGVKAWVTYKAVMKALQLKDAYSDWRKLSGGISEVTANLAKGQGAGQKFGQAMKGIGWTALIAVVAEFGKELYHIASGAAQAEENMARLQKTSDRALQSTSKNIKQITGSLEDQLRVINNRLKSGEIKSEKEANLLREKAIKLSQKELYQNALLVKARRVRYYDLRAEVKEIDKKIKADQKEGKGVEEQYKRLKEIEKELNVKGDVSLFGQDDATTVDILSQLDANIKSTLQSSAEYYKQLKNVSDQTDELDAETKSLSISTGNHGKAVKELNTQLKEQNEYLSNQNDLLHEIDQIKLEQQINDLDLNIEKSKEDALKRAELTGKVELEATRDLINERAILEKKALDDRINYEIDKITEEYRLKSVEARKSIEDDRLEKLAQENLTNDDRLKIEADYQLKIDQLNYDDLQRKGDLELEIKKIKLNSSKSQIEIEKKKNDEIEATTKELNDKQEEFAEATRVKIADAEEKARKKRFDEIIKWEELITAFFEKQIDKRIALLEKESEAHQKQQDFFRELAENGNINAQQSLAEEAKLQREADAEKEKLEKRKQYLQAVSAFMVSYTNKLEAGKTGTQALTEALAEKAVLESILNTIPAFKEGGTHEGGLMLVNDASGSRFREIIETPDGNLFSPTQRNVVMDAPKGTKIHTQNQWEELQNNMRSNDAFRNSNSLGGNIAGNSFDIAPLVKEMRSLKNFIKNQPDRSHEIEQMVTGILNFKITEKKGNTTRRIKHQYRS